MKTIINFECKDTKTQHIYINNIMSLKDFGIFVLLPLNRNMVYLIKGVF